MTYAQALFDAARDCGKIDEIGADFAGVTEVLRQNPSLKKLFLIPTLSAYEKKQTIKAIFEGHIEPELLNFLCILIDKHRNGVWEGIGRQYEKLAWESEGRTKGVLYTVVPVEGSRLSALEEKVGAALGKKVKLNNHIDKTIIGGTKIYIDGKLIDASLKTQLDNMKQRIIL